MTNSFIKKLSYDKIKINWNKNPVRMDLFLSFLTVETERSKGFLGECTGWTQLTGDNGLIVSGGKVGGVEYLDHLQYKTKLDNPYNNYVNPLYLFEILNNEGKAFFLDYYSKEIEVFLAECATECDNAKTRLENAISKRDSANAFFDELKRI